MKARLLAGGLWLLAGAAVADRVAAPPAAVGALVGIAEQQLAELEPQARARIVETRQRLDAMLGDGGGDGAQLAAVYGRLGALYAAHRLSAAASQAFDNARTLDPQAFNWVYYAAHLALDFGEAEAALALLDRAQALDAAYPTLSLRRGEALLGLSRLDQAEAAYRSALVQPEQRAAALYGLAQIDLLRRDWGGAAERLREVLRLDPGADSARYGLGQALLRLGQRDAAREYLGRVGTVKPAYPDPLVTELQSLQRGAQYHFERAMAAVNRGEPQTAVEEFAAGLAETPGNARARTSYARALWIAGQHDRSLAELRRAAADGPQETLPRFLLAAAAEAAGDADAAAAGYREVIAIDPGHQGALSYLGGLELRRGDAEAAADLLGAAIAAGGNVLPMHLHHWGALRAAGRPAGELRAKLEAYDQRFPEPPLFRYLLAKLLIDIGRYDEAHAAAAALQQDQPIPPHAELLALARAHLGDFAAAAELVEGLAEQARLAQATAPADRLAVLAKGYRDGRLPGPLWAPDDPMLVPRPVDADVAMRNYPGPNPY